ncbi:nucleotide exchange factor GrpE [Jiulongibacter sediminis]|uniref:nucleotide exchange factor GrpE n=1 Tax=Jiulongibacter sediminis TaxID=1605367 RepID=UPI0026EE6A26|nr:nucleotide exchange factor GrpE [Jiulongibacter sediminis]
MSKKNNTEEIKEELAEEKLTTEETETTDEELSEEEKLSVELAEQKDKFIRLYSEFENFRRRTAKEKVDIVMNASEGLIKELLPVLDDFERAQQSFENAKDIEAIKEGVELVFGKLKRTLENKGLKPMDSKGTDFDAEVHECITQFDGGEEQKGKVIDVVEKGYYLNDKVVRYAKVVVGS